MVAVVALVAVVAAVAAVAAVVAAAAAAAAVAAAAAAAFGGASGRAAGNGVSSSGAGAIKWYGCQCISATGAGGAAGVRAAQLRRRNSRRDGRKLINILQVDLFLVGVQFFRSMHFLLKGDEFTLSTKLELQNPFSWEFHLKNHHFPFRSPVITVIQSLHRHGRCKPGMQKHQANTKHYYVQSTTTHHEVCIYYALERTTQHFKVLLQTTKYYYI